MSWIIQICIKKLKKLGTPPGGLGLQIFSNLGLRTENSGFAKSTKHNHWIIFGSAQCFPLLGGGGSTKSGKFPTFFGDFYWPLPLYTFSSLSNTKSIRCALKPNGQDCIIFSFIQINTNISKQEARHKQIHSGSIIAFLSVTLDIFNQFI